MTYSGMIFVALQHTSINTISRNTDKEIQNVNFYKNRTMD